MYYDVVSEYPTVNALDDYAVGFKKHVEITPEDIVNDKLFGVVKCDINPPKDLYVPVLPDNSTGKLLFHLNPICDKTYCSVELKLALSKGYKITKIHAALQYENYTGLFKNYVEHFIQMKIENNKPLDQKECDRINEHHKEIIF